MQPQPIELQNITFGYTPGNPLFQNLALKIHAGMITVVLGKSGSGKSTLLQLCNGMVRPEKGVVRIGGVPVDYNNLYPLRQSMGYVIQQVGLFPHLNIHDNISLLGKINDWEKPRILSRVNELAQMVELPLSYMQKYPHELSGGEKQRAGICRALFLDPPVMLMDEPFASLDARTRDTIADHLLRIQQHKRRTIVLVTHQWEDALKLCDHFVLLAQGSVASTGEKSMLKEVEEAYLNEMN